MVEEHLFDLLVSETASSTANFGKRLVGRSEEGVALVVVSAVRGKSGADKPQKRKQPAA